MLLIEKLEWLCLGILIGFALGILVNKYRSFREEHGSVETRPTRNRTTFIKNFTASNIALLIVVLITGYAAIMSQIASNHSNDASNKVEQLQADQQQNLNCVTKNLLDAIDALNERTTYSGAQADANVELLKSQLAFLQKLMAKPPPSTYKTRHLFITYTKSVEQYLDLVVATKAKQIVNPYPTPPDLAACLTPGSFKENQEP